MNVLVIGSGGREHALCWALRRSGAGARARLFCAPGNAGIQEVAECVPLGATDVPGLADFAERERVGLTVVGGEAPLAAGLAYENEMNTLCFAAGDHLEGIRAFQEKRPAAFNS